MELVKIALVALINLVVVMQIDCVPISDKKEVLEYLHNFGYLTKHEKITLNEISNDHEHLNGDKRFKRALNNLQKNGNLPITGKYDDETAALMKSPRCGVSDEILNNKHHKRYALMSTKWPTTSLTYRFDHMNKEKYIEEDNNIRRIIREAFNVWEKDSVLKFTETKNNVADIMISFQHPNHIDVDSHILSSHALGHAFQPGKSLGGDIHLNELIKWDFDVSYDSKPLDGKISFYAVMLHQIGHSLGLDHTRDNEAVMYEFYSQSSPNLAEDDIRGIHAIYGVPPNKKYKPTAKIQESEEDRPVWEQTTRLPDKCNTSYDAVAFIDDEVIAFKGKFMFSKNMDLIEIRHRWRNLSPKMTHVDAVYQTTDGKTLFFLGQAVYSFIGRKHEKTVKLSDLGIDSSVLKIDAIFRRPDSQRTYIFIGNHYHRFDEHKMMVTGYSNRISKVFRDVYDMDTAFTNQSVTYFFKNEFYYEFLNRNWKLERMAPDLSGNFFMNCSLENPINRVVDFSFEANAKRDYIDEGPQDDEPDCENPEINLCDSSSVASFKKISLTLLMLGIPRIFG